MKATVPVVMAVESIFFAWLCYASRESPLGLCFVLVLAVVAMSGSYLQLRRAINSAEMQQNTRRIADNTSKRPDSLK